MKNKYHWVPDLPDARDHLYNASLDPLPLSVDLRSKCPPVVDQGDLGSCTANALAGALGFIDGITDPLSRLFIYYNERSVEHTIKTDSGAMLRDGISSLHKLGACDEALCPYVPAHFKLKPSMSAYSDALKRKIASYARLVTLDDMLACLAEGFPFVFGFTVYESFESEEVAKTGIVSMPGKIEKVLGGHAVMAVGYNHQTQEFLVRNSWGTDWGQGGYFTMPFAYLSNRNLSDDFWTIRK